MAIKVPSREQLKKFLPDHESIVQFEKLFGNATSLDQLVANIITASGLNTDGTYITELLAHYINIATSLADADKILDNQIYSIAQRLINTTLDYTVPIGNYSIMCDSTSGNIIVTLPLASVSTAYIIGVTKTDISSNTVTIVPSGVDLICGSSSQVLLYENEVLNFISDGTNWQLAN